MSGTFGVVELVSGVGSVGSVEPVSEFAPVAEVSGVLGVSPSVPPVTPFHLEGGRGPARRVGVVLVLESAESRHCAVKSCE